MRVLLKYRQDLCLKNGLVYHKVQLKNHQLSIQQFVLPESFHRQVILTCHEDFGHLGMKKTLGLLKDRFFWPKCLKRSHSIFILVCGPELGHTSAVCIVTLLAPHGPDLIPRGCHTYCKGGAP